MLFFRTVTVSFSKVSIGELIWVKLSSFYVKRVILSLLYSAILFHVIAAILRIISVFTTY